MSDVTKQFKEKYLEVFDKDNNIQACGRAKCKELMDLAKQLKDDNFGDSKTCRLNVENITKLYSEIKDE